MVLSKHKQNLFSLKPTFTENCPTGKHKQSLFPLKPINTPNLVQISQISGWHPINLGQKRLVFKMPLFGSILYPTSKIVSSNRPTSKNATFWKYPLPNFQNGKFKPPNFQKCHFLEVYILQLPK